MNYVYGQDGQRAAKYTAQSETLYFNKMWTLHTDGGNSHLGGEYAKNVYLGETRIVTKLVSANEIRAWEEVNKIYFYHSDHLGSASLITDENGNEYQRLEYTPYGEVWVDKYSQIQESAALLPYKFTGKERDEETGLYYYGARYLDAKYSRWISTDPALGEYIPAAGKGTADEVGKLPGIGGAFNSVNLNLYHYAGNNPIKYTDPDGNSILSGLAKTIVGTVQAAIGTAGTFLCSAGAVALAADDATLIGVLDDPLVLLLAAGATASTVYGASGLKLAADGLNETAIGVTETVSNAVSAVKAKVTEKTQNQSQTTLYRAVNEKELASIKKSGGRFSMGDNSTYERGKLFQTNPADAYGYAKLANQKIAKNDPYVAIVATSAPKGSYISLDSIIDAPSAVIVPKENLPLLTPAVIAPLEN